MVAGTFVGVEFNKIKNLLMLIFPLSFYGGLYFCYAFAFALEIYDYAGLLIIAPLWWALCLKLTEDYAALKTFYCLPSWSEYSLYSTKIPTTSRKFCPTAI